MKIASILTFSLLFPLCEAYAQPTDNSSPTDTDSIQGNDLHEAEGVAPDYVAPDDTYGIGYNDWFEDKIGSDFTEDERGFHLGLHYQEYFDQKLDSFNPDGKGPLSIYSGAHPGYLSNGFQSFRTVGPWTTRFYAAGYYAGKGVELVVLGALNSKVLRFAPTQTPIKTRVGKGLVKTAAGKIPDGLGEASSYYGQIFDNTDVISNNVLNMIRLMEDPNTYRQPFSPWPPLQK